MVQKYDTQGHIDCVEAKNGRYVSYEDYAALELKVLAALSHLERASEASNLGLQTGYLKMALRVLQND